MAKKNKNQINTAIPAGNPSSLQPDQKNVKKHDKRAPEKTPVSFGDNWNNRKPSIQTLVIAGIAAITWFFYKGCLNNLFTNWDDPGYVKDNALIKDVSFEGIKNIFSTSVMGNYHPLTILTYAIEYSYVRLQPWLYHLDSVLFHIVVTILVYWFVNLLTRRQVAAAVAALLFGLHPMHVESIAWIAGRKDVVYGAFYMAACIAYVYYVRATGSKKWKWYGGVIILFVCSLLSKPVAVSLPVTLFLIDYFEDRKFSYRLILEKIPHFVIAIGFGIRSVFDQKEFGSLGTQNVTYNFLERIALGTYAFITYLWKAVVPVGLSNFYPYPEKINGSISLAYYIYPVAVAAILFILWKYARKNKIVVFGSLFFLVNIMLLLQFIPVGGAILADRYAYIPYLGLFIMAGWFVSTFLEPGIKKELRYIAVFATLACALFFGYLSQERCKVWYDATTMWRDEIEKEPVRAPNAYNNLGFNYFNRFNDAVDPNERKIYYDSSFLLLNKAIELQPTFANPYISLGELERSVGKFAEARRNYYTAIALRNQFENGNAYLGLAIIYAITHNFDSSGICFRMAIELKPYFPEAYSNYGNYFDMMGKQDSALKEYGIAISQNPDMVAPYLNRGRTLQRLHRCDEAMKDFATALELSPGMGEVYYSRSYCYTQKGNKVLALHDVQKAISLGFTNIDKNYYEMLKR